MSAASNNAKLTALWAEMGRTFRLGYPIVGAQLMMFSMVFVDNIMVGPLGAEPLAALALATGMYSLVNIVVIGMLGAISPMITQPLGQGDFAAVGNVVRQGWFFALILTGLLIVVLWFSGPIMIALKQKADLIPTAETYLRIMCVTAPAHMLMIATRHVTEGSEDSMAGAAIMGGAALLNIPLDYWLIHGGLGLAGMGVAGAATATATLSWLSLIALALYLFYNKRYHRFQLWAGPWKVDAEIMREMWRVGLPLGGAIAAEMAFFVSSTLVMGTISADTLAAHQVALNAASMAFMIPLGLSFAVSIRVGHFRGQNDMAGVRTAWKAGIVITLATQIATALLFFLFPEWIVKLYSQSDEVASLAVRLLMVAAFFQLFDGLQVLGMGGLRGLKDTGFAFKATMLAFWGLGATTVFITYTYFDRSPIGVWIGLLVGLGSAALIHHTRIHLTTK